MPQTALKVDDRRLVIITSHEPEGLVVFINLGDENYKPIERLSAFVHSSTEEEYHKGLRAEANLKGHFIPERSTNPEWNESTKSLFSIDPNADNS